MILMWARVALEKWTIQPPAPHFNTWINYREVEFMAKIRTHGMANTRLHHIWKNMKQRCYYIRCKCYKHYGERGVVVCDEWKNDFKVFYD